MAVIGQTLNSDRIASIPEAVAAELEKAAVRNQIRSGDTVALTAGSRGIADIAGVLRAAADYVKSCGGRPFIVPAMGSHGGAAAGGQTVLLSKLGITEDSAGCEIRSTMETDEIGRTPDDIPVFADRHVRSADHVIVINRIKPHTKFKGPVESGLMKMMAVGMGKAEGARRCHQAAVQLGLSRVIETAGAAVLSKLPILCGIGLVENGQDQLAVIRALEPDRLYEGEKRLLIQAREKMAKIPFTDIDLLIVDEMGKNISGTGMDTNVTGVNRDIAGVFETDRRTRRLFVRDLTLETQGNALGIGFADFTTARLVQKIDRRKTYVNCLTAISPEKAAIPMYFESDRECIDAAVQCLGMPPAESLRIVHIKNTLELGRLHVSTAYQPDIEASPALSRISGWAHMRFNESGNMASPFSNSKNEV